MTKCDFLACPERSHKATNGMVIMCDQMDSATQCAMYRMWKRFGYDIYKSREKRQARSEKDVPVGIVMDEAIVFDTAEQAAELTGLSKAKIYKCASGKSGEDFGNTFRFETDRERMARMGREAETQ